MTDPNGAAIYGAPWIPSIYPLYVRIYTSTMDPMGLVDLIELAAHSALIRLRVLSQTDQREELTGRRGASSWPLISSCGKYSWNHRCFFGSAGSF